MAARSFLQISAILRRRKLNRPARGRRALLVSAVIGLVSACDQDTQSPTEPIEPTESVALAAAALSFFQVDGGNTHTCGITTDNRAYCWGDNSEGQLGDGTEIDHLTPVPVVGGLRFRQISAGWFTTCAITTDYRAYCWGHNGAMHQQLTPTRVETTVRFRQISTGGRHVCAVGYDDRLPYCWGNNHVGQLGEGSTNSHRTPIAAAGKLRMREVNAGFSHTCGVTTSDVAWCWGWNGDGELGQRTAGSYSNKPIRVSGGRSYRSMTTGWYHSCGITTGSRAYCWGRGTEGQLGDGSTSSRFAPRAVAGSVLFDRVTGGEFHTCAESKANTAYCWGANNTGQGGNGSSTSIKPRPTAVAGGHTFAQVSAGSHHTCGKTTASKAYCWGWNPYGQVGDGTTTTRFRPVPVSP